MKSPRDAMTSAHSLCPLDMPHLERMEWMANYFTQHCAELAQFAASHQRLKEALRNVMTVMPVCPKNIGIAGIEARYNAAVVGAREALRSTP